MEAVFDIAKEPGSVEFGGIYRCVRLSWNRDFRLSQWYSFYIVPDLAEIKEALKALPSEAKWEIAQWLLAELHEASAEEPISSGRSAGSNAIHPDYAQRRREIFKDQTIPNIVLSARAEDRG